MSKKQSIPSRVFNMIVLAATFFTHWIIFYFIIINSFKPRSEASELSLGLPKTWHALENYLYVLRYNNGIFFRSLWNSLSVTVVSISVLVVVSAMTAFILQRRQNRLTQMSNKLILAGLIVPPSVIPTYWILARLHVVGTMPGLALVEIATLYPFSVMMYKGFMTTLPRDIDSAALIDGCSSTRLFFQIIFPMLKPITATVIILRSVVVYNDFSNPLYYMAGAKNSTIQLCIYIFQSAFLTDWGHLFAAIVLVSLPPFILYLFLNKKILSQVTTGAVKG